VLFNQLFGFGGIIDINTGAGICLLNLPYLSDGNLHLRLPENAFLPQIIMLRKSGCLGFAGRLMPILYGGVKRSGYTVIFKSKTIY